MPPKFIEFFEQTVKEVEESSSIEDFLQERVPSKALLKQLFIPVDCEGMGGRLVVQIERPKEEGAWFPLEKEAVCEEVRFASETLRESNEEVSPESSSEMDLALPGVPYVPEKKQPFWKRLKKKRGERRSPDEEDDSPP